MVLPAFSVHLAHPNQLNLELLGAQRLILSMTLDSVKLQWMLAGTERAQ